MSATVLVGAGNLFLLQDLAHEIVIEPHRAWSDRSGQVETGLTFCRKVDMCIAANHDVFTPGIRRLELGGGQRTVAHIGYLEETRGKLAPLGEKLADICTTSAFEFDVLENISMSAVGVNQVNVDCRADHAVATKQIARDKDARQFHHDTAACLVEPFVRLSFPVYQLGRLYFHARSIRYKMI